MKSVTLRAEDKDWFEERCVCCAKSTTGRRELVPESPHDREIRLAGSIAKQIPLAGPLFQASTLKRSLQVPLCTSCSWQIFWPSLRIVALVVLSIAFAVIGVVHLVNRGSSDAASLYFLGMLAAAIPAILLHRRESRPFPVEAWTDEGTLYFTIYESSALFKVLEAEERLKEDSHWG